MKRNLWKYACFLLFLLAGSMFCCAPWARSNGQQVHAEEKKYTNDEYGEELLYEYGEQESCVVITGIPRVGDTLYIPAEIDGKPVVSYKSLSGETKQIKRVLLSKCFSMKQMEGNERDMAGFLDWFPNLTSLEFPEGSDTFCLETGGVYDIDRKKLLAVLPYAESLEIPAETEDLNPDCLLPAKRLKALQVSAQNTVFRSAENILYTKDGKTLLWAAPGLTARTVRIPNGVKWIGSFAFAKNSILEKVILPKELDRIGSYAFWNCKRLKTICWQKNLRHIQEKAFKGCISLTEIVLPDGLVGLDGSAFQKCKSVTRIVLPDGLVSMKWYVFKGCKEVRSLSVPPSMSERNWRYVFGRRADLSKIRIVNRGGEKKKAKKQSWGKVDDSWYQKGKKNLTISTAAQLASFMKMGAKKRWMFHDKKIVLAKDLDMKAYPEYNSTSYSVNEFCGIFDGKGHCIKNMRCPLFYAISSDASKKAQVLNLTVRGTIKGNRDSDVFIGGVVCAAFEKAIVKNCRFYGSVKGPYLAGGIVGIVGNPYNDDPEEDSFGTQVVHCTNFGSVSGSYFVGGITGNCVSDEQIMKKNQNKGKLNGIRNVGKICGLSGMRFEWYGDNVWERTSRSVDFVW